MARAKNGSVILGVLAIVLSVVAFLFGQSHAPGNISAALTGGWVLKVGPYYGIIAVAVLLAVCGVVILVQAFTTQRKG